MSAIPHSRKEGKEYQNPIPTIQVQGGFLKILWKYITATAERIPKKQLGPFYIDPSVYNTPPSSGLRVTWMGHSSMLIEIDGKRLLTDPVMGRASFLSSVGPKRFFPYPLPIDQWPELDGIILSHDHYDHLDHSVMLQLKEKKMPFYCSIGVGDILVKWGIDRNRITELDWKDTVTIGGDLSITAYLQGISQAGVSLTATRRSGPPLP